MTATVAKNTTAASMPPCALHAVHRPANLTVEAHHVIPVGWQLFWQPAIAPFPGKDQDGRGQLWDERTIWLAPTCHRNVHFWIVAMMHALHAAGSEDPLVAYKGVRSRFGSKEFATAYDALTRFRAAGGSLLALAAAGQWGQA